MNHAPAAARRYAGAVSDSARAGPAARCCL